MNWIDEFVAVGSILDVERVSELKEENIDLIIDARIAFTKGMITTPITPKIMRLAGILVELSKLEVKTLIHCVFGIDRTPFLAMVYVSKKYSVSYEEAYSRVKEMRPETIFHWDWAELLKRKRRYSVGNN